jgi:DNA-binding NarL/FixJ family response regulator
MRPFRILVVDDFERFRGFFCSALQQRAKLEVSQASDGFEAIHKAGEFQPDLVVFDIGLPKLNGIEVARTLRERTPTAKIMFLSQESSPDVIQEALSVGALGYVHKTRA